MGYGSCVSQRTDDQRRASRNDGRANSEDGTGLKKYVPEGPGFLADLATWRSLLDGSPQRLMILLPLKRRSAMNRGNSRLYRFRICDPRMASHSWKDPSRRSSLMELLGGRTITTVASNCRSSKKGRAAQPSAIGQSYAISMIKVAVRLGSAHEKIVSQTANSDFDRFTALRKYF